MVKKLVPSVGNWVDGDRFWGRETEIELFTEHLRDGANILLVAQRRIGKTSLMREVANRIGEDFVCLHVDLQKSHSAADAIVELSVATREVQDLWGKTKDLFANITRTVLDRIDSLQYEELRLNFRAGIDNANWEAKGCALFDILASHEKPVVIFFDEVPILVNRILKGYDYEITPERVANTDAFMSWLRYCVNNGNGNAMVVLTGSVGLGPILHQARLSATINEFMPFELRPWDDQTAIGCLEALANGKGLVFQDGVCQDMVTRLGSCIPHHVQLYFSFVHDHCSYAGATVVTSSDAQEVYNRSMLSSRGHSELYHYEERLQMVLGKELLPLALDLLTEAAVTGELVPSAASALADRHRVCKTDTVLMDILNMLEHDGYLERSNGVYVFVSKLLRDWWSGHFGFRYVPVSEGGAN